MMNPKQLNIFCLVLTLFVFEASASQVTCDHEAWEKIGCFQDNGLVSDKRPLPNLVLSDRDQTSKVYSGKTIDWKNWKNYSIDFLCRCAEAAKAAGYDVIGLQFYGECWGAHHTKTRFDKDGPSQSCISDLGIPPVPCELSNNDACFGELFANYIYKLKEGPSPCHNLPKALDIGVIVDSSTSIETEHYEQVRSFLTKLVAQFDVLPQATHFGIIVFSSDALLLTNFSNPTYHRLENLKTLVASIPYLKGSTATDKALKLANTELFTESGGDRPDKPNVLLIFTDGKADLGSEPFSTVLPSLKQKKVKTIAIGIGPLVDQSELSVLAFGEKENVISVKDFDHLVGKLNELLDNACKNN